MSNFVIDVEADSKSPASGSMISFGCVFVLDTTKSYYGAIAPISDQYDEETAAISGITRDVHLGFDEPHLVMEHFAKWVRKTNQSGKPVLWSDNPAFDWMWICYYFDKFNVINPFGYSARRIGDLYCGYKHDIYAPWKQLRDTEPTHHPVTDAIGNAEALLKIYLLMNNKCK